ncbi:hypothetical protein J2Z50_002565 [Ensifer mexicanus]|nr:hypothetical protein [Sinorhizobium mexicanum]
MAVFLPVPPQQLFPSGGFNYLHTLRAAVSAGPFFLLRSDSGIPHSVRGTVAPGAQSQVSSPRRKHEGEKGNGLGCRSVRLLPLALKRALAATRPSQGSGPARPYRQRCSSAVAPVRPLRGPEGVFGNERISPPPAITGGGLFPSPAERTRSPCPSYAICRAILTLSYGVAVKSIRDEPSVPET